MLTNTKLYLCDIFFIKINFEWNYGDTFLRNITDKFIQFPFMQKKLSASSRFVFFIICMLVRVNGTVG